MYIANLPAGRHGNTKIHTENRKEKLCKTTKRNNMMKKTRIIISIIFLIVIISCVETGDFEIPKVEMEEPEISANSNIKAIKNAYEQSGEEIFTFDASDDSIISGYVISSDEAGNFYKSLFIQDTYENPTSGIEILIDQRAYFTKYNFGRKIFVKMAGLSITNNEGKYKIGYNIRNGIEKIPSFFIDDFLIRSTVTENINPKLMTLAEFKNNWIGIYIRINDIQFKSDEIGKTFAGEEFDEFNGERVLIQCENQISTVLSTSTFSDFKSNLLSNNKGALSAVLTKDFYGEKYILVLNDLSTFDFMEGPRCDPEYLTCNSDIENDSKLLFFENFQEIKKTKDLEDLGWTNTNIYYGNEKFKKRSSQGNNSMQISAYNSGENPLEVWLVTPPINLDNSSNEILTFDTKASYDNGSILTAWVSTDFHYEIKEATWQQLDVKISVGPGNNYVNDFTSSGEISLDCLNGDVSIAIKYLGGDPGISTTYDIDNMKVEGN